MTDSMEYMSSTAEVPVLEQKVLIVEDETIFAKAVQKRLKRVGLFSEIASDLETARRLYKSMSPNLILLDMRLPDGSGIDFLEQVRKDNKAVPVIVMSAYGEIEDAVSAMKLGASDYLKKPVDLDELIMNIDKVLSHFEVEQKLSYSEKREQHANESVDFIGECQAMQDIVTQVERISRLTQNKDTIPPTVLILGETGTGKDVMARLLHANSARAHRPFVHVDCASLPKDLIESELFGHEKGAFTNAHTARTGLIEAAEDGVLFLDEIGEIPLDLQSKLLAVLERRTLRKVGTTQERPVAAWIIAATNRDIEGLAEEGAFRSDLYYRLNVLSIMLPPLSDRDNDRLLLAEYFADKTAHRYGLGDVQLSEEAKKAILEYRWPGNIREMKHLIERAVLLSVDGKVDANMLNLNQNVASKSADASSEQLLADDMTLGEAEYNLIKQALEKTNGNVSQAARELGITRMALRYRIKKYHL